jgi:hypothetical protein
MAESEYLLFEEQPRRGKTGVWNVVSQNHGNVLGEVKWFGPWRQYCFFPGRATIWNKTCLADVETFIKDQMAARRQAKA